MKLQIIIVALLIVFGSGISAGAMFSSMSPASNIDGEPGILRESDTFDSLEVSDHTISILSLLLQKQRMHADAWSPPCPWDVNYDGIVSPQDVGLVKYYYGQDPSIPEYAVYDVNDDGFINPQDVGLIKYYYGPCY